MKTVARLFPTFSAVSALLVGMAASAAAAPPDQVSKGQYLATMGDCQACHTASGGQPFAGGLMMNTPFGQISTPNITPDKDTGIGNYTDEQFIHLFRAGIGKDGQHIYPVMPYPWYTKVTDEDILAIKAYLFSMAPVNAPRKKMDLAFPFNVRAGLAAWDVAFLKQGAFKPDPTKSDQINRGAYIVEGLEHCGECHDSRNMLGAGAISKPLQGGQIDHWYAPNITSDVRTGIGKFSDDELVAYLKTGAAPSMGTVVGPMAQTIHESTSHLTEADLRAVVAYLKSTPAVAVYKEIKVADPQEAGAQAYLNHCASCHQLDGKGIANAIPSLIGNGAVASGGPETMIRVIVGGVEAQGTYGLMPAVGNGMTDQEVADSVNYVRSSWSNAAPATTGPGEVATIRKLTQTYLSGTLPEGCPTLAQADMAKIVADPAVATLLQGVTEQTLLQNVNQIIAKVKAAGPNIAQADIVNSLTIAYCPIVRKDTTLNDGQKLAQLNQFGARVYTQLAQKGKD